MGRLYLPLDWMRAVGLDPDAFLADPRPSPALAAVVARLLAEADRLYRRAEAGIAQLPPRCRPAIRAAGLIYREIGCMIAAAGHDTVTRRARVDRTRKLALIARAVRTRAGAAELAAPALPQAVFLIEAVSRHPLAPLRQRAALRPWWDVVGRAVHVLDLIERMREREAFGRSAPS